MTKTIILKEKIFEKLEEALKDAVKDKGNYTCEVVTLGGVAYLSLPEGDFFVLPLTIKKTNISGYSSPR